jgi:hypothetical protein
MRTITLWLALCLAGCSGFQFKNDVQRGIARASVEKNLWGPITMWSQSGCGFDKPSCPEIVPTFTDDKLQFFYQNNGDRIDLYADHDLLELCRTQAPPEEVSRCSSEHFLNTLKDIVRVRQMLYPDSPPVHLKVFLYLHKNGYFKSAILQPGDHWEMSMIYSVKMADSDKGMVFLPTISPFSWAATWLHEYIHTQDKHAFSGDTRTVECPAWIGSFFALDAILDSHYDGTIQLKDMKVGMAEKDHAKQTKLLNSFPSSSHDNFAATSAAYQTYEKLRTMALAEANIKDIGSDKLPESVMPILARLVREVLHGKRPCSTVQ